MEEKAQGEQVRKEEVSSSFYDLLEEIETHATNADVIIVDNLSPLRTAQPFMVLVSLEVSETTPTPATPITDQSLNV